ncbi:MAG: hypothetical protein ACFN1J_03035 [Bacteroidota bacterium]
MEEEIKVKEHHLPKGLILQWAKDSVDDSKNPKRQTINLQSYAKGLRHEDLEENKSCNLTKRFASSKTTKCETKKRVKKK